MCCHGPLEIPGNAPKWDSSITVKLCIERLALATGITQSTSKDEILGLIVFNCHTYFYQTAHEEQGESTAEGQKSHIHPLWRTVHEEIVLKYSMLYLLTEECTGARSSNLVEGLITRPTMYDHCSRSKG